MRPDVPPPSDPSSLPQGPYVDRRSIRSIRSSFFVTFRNRGLSRTSPDPLRIPVPLAGAWSSLLPVRPTSPHSTRDPFEHAPNRPRRRTSTRPRHPAGALTTRSEPGAPKTRHGRAFDAKDVPAQHRGAERSQAAVLEAPWNEHGRKTTGEAPVLDTRRKTSAFGNVRKQECTKRG